MKVKGAIKVTDRERSGRGLAALKEILAMPGFILVAVIAILLVSKIP